MDERKPHAEPVVQEAPDPTPQFLGRLAHDLRGPLSPLQTAAYLLKRDDLDEDRRVELLDIIDRQTRRLSSMVQEVSDWVRAREARLVTYREVVTVPMLLDLAAANLGAGVALEAVPQLDEACVEVDVQRILQLLEALVEFLGSRAPQVRVEANADRGRVRLLVAAPGSGWQDQDERDTLFQQPQAAPFDEGLGMRLLVARSIAEAHGGELAGVDAPDGSAAVWLYLPLADCAALESV